MPLSGPRCKWNLLSLFSPPCVFFLFCTPFPPVQVPSDFSSSGIALLKLNSRHVCPLLTALGPHGANARFLVSLLLFWSFFWLAPLLGLLTLLSRHQMIGTRFSQRPHLSLNPGKPFYPPPLCQQPQRGPVFFTFPLGKTFADPTRFCRTHHLPSNRGLALEKARGFLGFFSLHLPLGSFCIFGSVCCMQQSCLFPDASLGQ